MVVSQSRSSRLQELLDSLSLNPRSFALELGMDRATTIYNIFNRDAKISKKLLDKICTRFTQVNREWLMTGHGSMYLGSTALEDDLTVTAKQVLEVLNPKIDQLLKEMEVVKARVLGLELQGAHKAITKKKTNGV